MLPQVLLHFSEVSHEEWWLLATVKTVIGEDISEDEFEGPPFLEILAAGDEWDEVRNGRRGTEQQGRRRTQLIEMTDR